MTTRARTPLSDEHKTALAEGREQGRIVRRYLEALEANKPRRGRKRSPESIRERLDEIETAIPTSDPLKRLRLIQQRIDLEVELESTDAITSITDLEPEFVEVAASYGDRKGISYTAWRELGVPSPVLARAGVSRAG